MGGSSVKVRDNWSTRERCQGGIAKVGTVTKDEGYYNTQPYQVDVCPSLWLHPNDVETVETDTDNESGEEEGGQDEEEEDEEDDDVPSDGQLTCGSCTHCLRIGSKKTGKCKDNWNKAKCDQ